MSTHTHQFITRHFSSLRHAKILGRCLMLALLIGGSSFAAPLQIPGLSRANIGIKKIFLSTNGESTNAGTSQIILDGTNGDVTIAGTVHIPTHKCITAGNCTLKVGPSGVLALTSAVAANGGNTTSTGELYTKDGSTPTDTGAYDIYFGDPALTTGTVTDSVKVRVGLEGTGTGNTSQLLARGKIETRDGFSITSPINQANKINLSITSTRTTSLLDSDTLGLNHKKAFNIATRHLIVPVTTSSDIILRSGTGSVPTRVGVNIPSGEYATRSLDVAGQTLSRNTLHVSGNNSVFYARPTAGAISGAVGIRTATPSQTLHVSGDSRLFGKATFVGNQTNLNSTNNGMTSTKLMEINKNTATTLTLEEVGCKILSVNETGHMVLTQVDAALCTPTNPNGTGNCPPLPTNAIANTVLTIPQVFSGGMWVPDPVWSYNVIPSTTECRYTCAPGYVQGSNLTPGYNYGLGSGNWTVSYGGSPIIKKQSNGKTIIFSHYLTHYSGVLVNGIARLNTDGTLDTTFNAGGSGFTLNPIRNIGTDMHVQPDDKIVAVGMFTHYNGTSSKGVIRLNANGSIDTSFNVGAGFNGIVQGLRPLPNNQYFVLGFSTSLYDGVAIPNFAKLNSNGSLDTTFMSNYVPAPGSWAVYDIQTQSNGKFIFGFAGPTAKMLTRYNTNGTTDTTFNNGGIGFTPANAPSMLWFAGSAGNTYSNPNIARLAVLPNDSIVAVGAFSHYNGYPANNIVKVDINGNLDTTFMTNIGVGINGYGTVSTYDPYNNRIFIGGSFSTFNNQQAKALVAINQDGTLNPSFPMTGFDKMTWGVTILDANTFYIQGEFNTFGPYSTLPGAAVFGPGCIPESFGNAACGTSHLSNATSQPTNPPIANVCASGIFSGFVGSSPRGWTCTNPVTNNSVACCTKYGMSISTGGYNLINSYKDLINNTSLVFKNYSSNPAGTVNTQNAARTMPVRDYIFGTLSGALWTGQQVTFNSFYYTGAGFNGVYNASSGTFNYFRTIWGGTAFNYNYYGAQAPATIIPNTPAYYPYMQQNHVYAAMLVPVATYQAFTGNKGFSAQNKIGGRQTGELRDLGIMIKDLDIISGAYLEGSGGYISLTEPTEYNAAHSSKGIIVVAKRKSSAVYEEFYILANYNHGGTLRWKNFDTCANQTTGYIPPTPTTPICGASSGGTFATIPTTNLCATGIASAVIGSGNQRLWSCGSNYGSPVNCSANNVNTTPPPSCYNCPSGYTLTGDLNNDGIPNCYSGSAGTNTTVYAFTNYNSRVSGHMFDNNGNSVSYFPSGIGGGNLPRCSCDNMINNGYYPGQGVSRGVVPFAECYKGGNTPYTTAFPSLAGVNNIVNTVDGGYPLTLQAWDGVTNGTPGSFSPSLNTTYFTGTDVGPLCLDYVSANYSNISRFFGGMAFVYIREGTVTSNGGVSSFNATPSTGCAGNCGTASGLNLLTIPSNSGFTAVPNTIYPAASTNLCLLGNASAITSNLNTWTWNCVPTTGATVACSSNKSSNGLCGSANGQPSVSAPSSNLCASGTATTVIATGLANGYSGRSWSCNGSNGGTNDSCGGYVPLSCSAIYARDQWTGYYTMSSNTGSWSVPYTARSAALVSINIPPCNGPSIIQSGFDYMSLWAGDYWTTFSWLNGVNASDTILLSGASTSVINMTPWVSLPRYNVTHPYILGDDVGTSCYLTYYQHPAFQRAIYTKVGYTDPDNKACTPSASACGTAHGNTYPDAASANAVGPLCSTGVASVASLGGVGPWTWNCLDGSMNVVSSCVAYSRAGVCGTADGGFYLSANDANIAGLCNNGIATPSSLVDPGPWTWNCSGTPSAACKAERDTCTSINVPQVCDPGNYRPVCGCDGNDYFNDCYANNANVGSRTNGVCTPEVGECGNGIVDLGEDCDDGNLNNADNCDNSCRFTIDPVDFGCTRGETMVTYTIGDDDNFDATMKLQGPYLPDADYKDWMSNYFTQGGTIPTPGQNLGNFDTDNNNDYYLAHIKLPPAPGGMRISCIGFELKAKESAGLMNTDSLYLMTKQGPVNPNDYGAGLNDYGGLVSQFSSICNMNNALFIPYAGTNSTLPFTLNVTSCPIDVVNSIDAGNDDLYLRGQDDHNPDYVRIHIGYL